jgi:ABC-type glycerol-3-phosphate transport system permease component
LHPIGSATVEAVRRRRRIVRRARLLPAWVFLLILAVSTLYPILFVGFTALKTVSQFAADVLGPPTSPTLENIRAVIDRGVLTTNALNSTIVSVAATVLTVGISSMAGFALAHLRVPFRQGLLLGITGLIVQPTALLMIPMIMTVSGLGLTNNYLGLVLVYTGLAVPFGTLLMFSFMRTQPVEIFDAARVDGASTLRVLWSIALPLARPALGALATLEFVSFWNEFLFALLLLQNQEQRTVVVAVSTMQAEQFLNVPILAAGMLISIVPPLIVFAVLHRQLFAGLTAGGLK